MRSLQKSRTHLIQHLTAAQLAAVIRLATSDQAMQERARAVGHTLRQEDGVAQAVRVIEAIRAAR